MLYFTLIDFLFFSFFFFFALFLLFFSLFLFFSFFLSVCRSDFTEIFRAAAVHRLGSVFLLPIHCHFGRQMPRWDHGSCYSLSFVSYNIIYAFLITPCPARCCRYCTTCPLRSGYLYRRHWRTWPQSISTHCEVLLSFLLILFTKYGKQTLFSCSPPSYQYFFFSFSSFCY